MTAEGRDEGVPDPAGAAPRADSTRSFPLAAGARATAGA